jgi:hyperosmotically inducible protein
MKKTHFTIRCLFVVMMIAAFMAGTSTPVLSDAGDVVDDSVITTKIKSKIAADDLLKAFQISVETHKGVVELSGFVDSQKTKDRAGQIARSVEGVKSVKNALILK